MSTPTRFLFIINAGGGPQLAAGAQRLRAAHGDVVRVEALDTDAAARDSGRLRSAIACADIIAVDVRGGGPVLGVIAAAVDPARHTVVVLAGGGPELMGLTRMGSFVMADLARRRRGGGAPGKPLRMRRARRLMRTVETLGRVLPVGKLKHARLWACAMRYWTEGGEDNVAHLLQMLVRHYGAARLREPPAPQVFGVHGLVDPVTGRRYDDETAYARACAHAAGRPRVALVLYGGMHHAQSLVAARALAEALIRAHGCDVLAIYAEAGAAVAALQRWASDGADGPGVQAVVTCRWFRLGSFGDADEEAAVRLLTRWNVPLYNACPLYNRPLCEWAASSAGLGPVQALTTAIMPEVDGATDPLPVVALDAERDHGGIAVRDTVPIAANAALLAGRIARRLQLARTPAAQRRVAIVVYDYPPGEENLGNAAYLDVFATVARLLARLRAAGYTVDGAPDAQELIRRFVDDGLANDPRWQGARDGAGVRLAPEAYAPLHAGLSDAQRIDARWGAAPGAIMREETGALVLGLVEYGNCCVVVQPARGWHDDPAALVHDDALPPHHQYAACYRYLDEHWGADALIHIGTHGTLEFLPGKEQGLSAACWPVALLGAVPHLYYYHVVNVSEASIARRRSLATLVNYDSPPCACAGLYDDLAALEDLLAEHHEARGLDPQRAARLEARLAEAAAPLGLDGEPTRMSESLARARRALIPQGLHVLDADPGEEARLACAAGLLRRDEADRPSPLRRLAAAHGEDLAALLRDPWRERDGRRVDLLAELDAELGALVAARRRGEATADAAAIDAALAAADARWRDDEARALLRALDGGYVVPGIGGDPLRDPAVLPTGRNSFQFDPRRVPSAAAMARGAQIAAATIAQHTAASGAPPRQVGVILWGFETAKTRGETVGQVFAYLGVELLPGANPFHRELRAIPLADLGRPRVDVHIQICGFFRDMFGTVVELIDRAVTLVAALDEDDAANPVRAHTAAARAALDAAGEDAALATARIYGPRPGEYGTRCTTLIEGASWQDEQEIVDTFTASMDHVYARGVHGVRSRAGFTARVGATEVVSQVRDSVDYEFVDLDHYYEFFGGLARTVEAARGTTPTMLVSDTTGEEVRTESVGAALGHGVRTRLVNPRWIEPLLQHAHHGGAKIADRVQYLVGFAATTHATEDWMFDAVHRRYVEDPELFARLRENNAYAAEQVVARLLEADRRNYWDASDAQRALLQQRYLEIEGGIEEGIDHGR